MLANRPGTSTAGDDAQSWLAAIAESSYDAIVGKDLNGAVTSWNHAAERLFGYSRQEIIGRPITTIIPPDKIAEEADIMDRVRRGERLVHFETQRMTKDGSVFPVSLTISPICDSRGQIIGISKIARDLTERRAHEHRINELQAELIHIARLTELGQMVSALAHEVNQPLTAITTYLSAVRRLLVAGNQQSVQQAVDKAAAQADRARQIIQRLRDLVSRGETQRRTEDLRKTIEEAAALALLGINPAPKLEIRVDPAVSHVVIDRVQIQQVLLNLVRNAAEAMVASPRRELVISAAASTAALGDMVEVSVADSGPGLPESIRQRLFEPFNTTKPNGLGVGLSVCRSIVEAHAGTMRAEMPESGGTIFRFTLPSTRCVTDSASVPRA